MTPIYESFMHAPSNGSVSPHQRSWANRLHCSQIADRCAGRERLRRRDDLELIEKLLGHLQRLFAIYFSDTRSFVQQFQYCLPSDIELINVSL
jgi:polyphosphate kinase 2 (PPK2 family)